MVGREAAKTTTKGPALAFFANQVNLMANMMAFPPKPSAGYRRPWKPAGSGARIVFMRESLGKRSILARRFKMAELRPFRRTPLASAGF